MRTCKHCLQEFYTGDKPKGWMANHSRWCEFNPKLKSYSPTKIKEKICIGCNNKFVGRNLKFCSMECMNRNKRHSDNTKNIMSNKRKLFLKNNPDKHPWKNDKKFISEPCENVKNVLVSKNINFISEYNPSDTKHYAIDIAIPDKMICIEINGNQHYNKNGKLKPYYKERHDFISSLGWTIYELHYSVGYSKDLNNIIDSIIKNTYKINNFSYDKYFLDLFRTKRRKQLEKRLKRINQCRKNKIKKQQSVIIFNKLINSDIDFTKYGWASKAADIISCKPQKVSKWFKTWYPDFYNDKCFKRKNMGR